ncbi:MAG: lytic transglycosylase domain-containing protein [Bdellovibrionales bacterium]
MKAKYLKLLVKLISYSLLLGFCFWAYWESNKSLAVAGFNLPEAPSYARVFPGFDLPEELNQDQLDERFRMKALTDKKLRINPDFRITRRERKRTSFWFDIYTKYDSSKIVVHHTEFPWMIFDVIDVQPIRDQSHLHKWTRYHKEKRYIKNQKRKIKATLKGVARKSFWKMNKSEKDMFKKLRKHGFVFQKGRRSLYKNFRSQTGQKDHFQAGLDRYNEWIEDIEEEFKAKGLPEELTRLPFVESSFNPKAVSKVGASGIWQIMPMFKKKFDFGYKGDPRNHPIYATKIAAFILKDNKRMLKDWPLAITAYNTGPSMLRKATRKLKTTNIETITYKFKAGRFGFASKNFYTSFLAALHAEKYKEYFFDVPISENKQVVKNESSESKGQTAVN